MNIVIIMLKFCLQKQSIHAIFSENHKKTTFKPLLIRHFVSKTSEIATKRLRKSKEVQIFATTTMKIVPP